MYAKCMNYQYVEKNGIKSLSIKTEIIFEVYPYSVCSKFIFSWNVNRTINHRCIFYITRKIENVALAAFKVLILKLRKCVI